MKRSSQAQAARKPFLKSDYITLETADKIKLSYQIGNPLLRLAAFFIDFTILLLLVIFINDVIAWLGFISVTVQIMDAEYLSALLSAFYYFIFFILRWFYYLFFEYLLDGRTPGKIICRLRTIHAQGKFLDLPSIMLRNFARLVDQDLTFFLGAAISMLATREYRRLGDLLGNTLVVREEPLKELTKTIQFELNQKSSFANTEPQLLLKRLSEYDLYVLRQFLNTYQLIPEPRRSELMVSLAKTIQQKIMDSPPSLDPINYLISVYERHCHGPALR